VTPLKPLLRKFVRLYRWSPASGGTARSDIQLSSQSSARCAARGQAFPTLISPIAVGGRAETSRPPSNKSTAALKSP
jgi:hypothetical protein